MTAGAVNGINPCLLSVVVFFLSVLLFNGYERKAIAVAGSVFIATVFVSSFIIGLGMLESFRQLERFEFLAKGFFYSVAIAAVVCGFLSLYDWWVYLKTADAKRFILKLPFIAKQKIHQVIRDNLAKAAKEEKLFWARLVGWTVVTGFLATLFEVACTGQLYLPAVVYMLKANQLAGRAFFYLFLYNLAFIVPASVIFRVCLVRMASPQFIDTAVTHLSKIKIIHSALFLAIGFGLFFVISRP